MRPSPFIVWPRYARFAPNNRWAAMLVKTVCDSFEVSEHRVAEHLVAVPGLVARLGPRLGPWRRQVDEPGRLGHRQRPQQHLVEQREDRRVRADPERERDDRDRGDERGLEERPEGKFQVDHRFSAGSDENSGREVYRNVVSPRRMIDASLLERLYRQSEAGRWSVSADAFRSALEASVGVRSLTARPRAGRSSGISTACT